MKTCPFCAEEIQDAAIKCRYCGEGLPGYGKEGAGRDSALDSSVPAVALLEHENRGTAAERLVAVLPLPRGVPAATIPPVSYGGATRESDAAPSMGWRVVLLWIATSTLVLTLAGVAVKTIAHHTFALNGWLGFEWKMSAQEAYAFAHAKGYGPSPYRYDERKGGRIISLAGPILCEQSLTPTLYFSDGKLRKITYYDRVRPIAACSCLREHLRREFGDPTSSETSYTDKGYYGSDEWLFRHTKITLSWNRDYIPTNRSVFLRIESTYK